MKSYPARILAASVLVLLVCFPLLAQSKRRTPSTAATKKPPAQKAEAEALSQDNPPTKKKMDCSTQPPMGAETEQALTLAGRRGEFTTTKQISRQGIKNAPNECGWYVMFVYATLKSPPITEAEADDVLFVIREFQRKKLPAYDWETVQQVRVAALNFKGEQAFIRGDFDKGVAELRKVVLLGNAAHKAIAHSRIATKYGQRYFETQSRSDATNSRDALRAILSDSVTLQEFMKNDPNSSNAMIVPMHGMLGLMENDLGNFNAAIKELETAQRLVQTITGSSDPTISRMVEIAKKNLQGGNRSTSVRIVTIQEIVEALK
ncbi:MAG: hypothetical protein M3X11_13480 [Acidobacteriota bacterium]|nr:hypothetical protein [Acidobacteriota bacterium]